MGGRNVVNRIQGKQSEYSDEEIMYTAMNNVMLTGLTSTVVRKASKYSAQFNKEHMRLGGISWADGLSGLFLPFVDGIRNSKSVSIFSKWAHGGKI